MEAGLMETVAHQALLGLIEKMTGPLLADDKDHLLTRCRWQQVGAGQTLINPGDRCEQWCVVLHGQLCGFHTEISSADNADFYRHRGDSFGQAALLGNGSYQLSLIAATSVRLAVFERDIFELLWHHYDSFKQHITREFALLHSQGNQGRFIDNKMTLFCQSSFIDLWPLATSLAQTQNIEQLIDLPKLAKQLGLPTEVGKDHNHPGWYDIFEWWQRLEDKQIMLLADGEFPAWTAFCTENSDRLLLFADGAERPPTEPLQLNFAHRFGAERWLILCHDAAIELPSGTCHWLAALSQPQHLHLRINHQADYSRIMRTVMGQAVGVVFGGGHARCFAQLGVVKAMQTMNMPIDMIGGTSFGALLAAHIAKSNAQDHQNEQIKASNEVLKKLKPFKALRWPGISLLKEQKFNWLAQTIFGDIDIEDMWLPFFCISTNLTTAAEVVHQHGSMRDAARATGSVPVLIAPARQGNEMLVDGGLVNNLPVDVMRTKTAGLIVAIDVGQNKTLEYSGDIDIEAEQGWFKRRKSHQANIFEIADRSMSLINQRKLNSCDDHKLMLLRLQLPEIKMTQFDAMESLIELGYQQSIGVLEEVG